MYIEGLQGQNALLEQYCEANHEQIENFSNQKPFCWLLRSWDRSVLSFVWDLGPHRGTGAPQQLTHPRLVACNQHNGPLKGLLEKNY